MKFISLDLRNTTTITSQLTLLSSIMQLMVGDVVIPKDCIAISLPPCQNSTNQKIGWLTNENEIVPINKTRNPNAALLPKK